jgi:hypothetical protein
MLSSLKVTVALEKGNGDMPWRDKGPDFGDCSRSDAH